MKFQGQAFRVMINGECEDDEMKTFVNLGAIIN